MMLEKNCAQGSTLVPWLKALCASKGPTSEIKNKFYLLYAFKTKPRKK